MIRTFFISLCFAVVAMLATGCQSQTELPASTTATPIAHDTAADHVDDDSTTADHGESEVDSALAQLSSEDRKEAMAQKFCAVMDSSLLGSMGAPVKLEINGEPVFVCCGGCKAKALRNPDQTLALVSKLKAANSAAAK